MNSDNVTAMIGVLAGTIIGGSIALRIARLLKHIESRDKSHSGAGQVKHANQHDEQRVNSSEHDPELKQLERLFDYTKFHIGLYTTLGAAYIAFMTSDYGKKFFIPNPRWVILAVVALLVAGFAGGIIASSCSHYTSFKTLMDNPLRPFKDTKSKLWPTGRTWAGIEHGAFWFGIGFAILSFNILSFDKILASKTSQPTVEIVPTGSSIVLDWTIPAGPSKGKYNIVDFGANRAFLICVESPDKVFFEINRVGGAIQKTLGDSASSLCEGADGNKLSATSPDGKSRKRKIVLLPEFVKQ